MNNKTAGMSGGKCLLGELVKTEMSKTAGPLGHGHPRSDPRCVLPVQTRDGISVIGYIGYRQISRPIKYRLSALAEYRLSVIS